MESQIPYFDYFTVPSTRLKLFKFEFGVSQDRSQTVRPLDGIQRSEYILPLRVFASSIHYGIKTLSITIPWFEILELIPCISACRALRELELVFDCYMPRPPNLLWNMPPLTIDDIGHVRKLSISTVLLTSSISKVAVNFFHLIRLYSTSDALRDLEELTLGFDNQDVVIHQLIDILKVTKNLRKLHWFGSSGNIQHPGRIRLNRLHTLVIEDGRNLRYLDVPNLVCFECSSTILRAHLLPSASTSNLGSITARPSFLY